MFDIPRFISDSVRKIREQPLDDAIDRLNYFITTWLLMAFATVIAGKQYFGQPIQCMMPAEYRGSPPSAKKFIRPLRRSQSTRSYYYRASIITTSTVDTKTTNWEKYAEDYCFIQSTYSYSMKEQLLMGHRPHSEQVIGYYQWVPFIFVIQALFFYLPNFIWNALQRQIGMDQQTIVSEAIKLRSIFGKRREDGTLSLSVYIGDCLQVDSRKDWFGTSRKLSAAATYFFIKFFYLFNVITQFFLINQVVGSNYTFWGWQVLGDLTAGRTPVDSGLFPRVTMCDFKKREIGNEHNYTTQCVLMINMLNEKLFLFLWFWYLFVALCTLVGFVYLFVTTVPSYFRERRVRQYLGGVDLKKYSGCQLRQFLYVKLGLDGLLLLRFIDHHAGALVARQLSARLWQYYRLPANRVDFGIDNNVPDHHYRKPIKFVEKN